MNSVRIRLNSAQSGFEFVRFYLNSRSIVKIRIHSFEFVRFIRIRVRSLKFASIRLNSFPFEFVRSNSFAIVRVKSFAIAKVRFLKIRHSDRANCSYYFSSFSILKKNLIIIRSVLYS